jgi:hypothetical protein
MEYIDGSSLDKIVRIRGPMDPLRAAHYIRQAALGLQHAHDAGLVHRDVKPANLLVDRTGTVKVLDMGLALFFREEADDLTRKQAPGAMGTADYMAPEQAQDSHAVDARADIYSLGATFYFLLRGRSPFKRGAARPKVVPADQPFPPLREFRSDLPEGLVGVIDRMLARNPAERYQSAAEVAVALAPWAGTPIPPPGEEEMPRLSPAAGGSEKAAEGQGSPTPSATSSTVPQSNQSPSDIPNPKSEPKGGSWISDFGFRISDGRRRQVAIAATFAALLVAGVLGFALYRASTRQTKPDAPGQPAGQTGAAAKTLPRLRLLVPAYFYPGDKGLQQWDRLIESSDAPGLVAIVNPKSGPGDEANRSYAEVIDRATKAGITVIGYVSTGYARRPLAGVKADVDRWVRFYPRIAGIFFDEQASGADQVAYYAALYEQVRHVLPEGLVVTNPGTLCAEEYLSRPATDVGCLAEVARNLDDYRVPSWAARYRASRFCALIQGVASLDRMKRYVREMPDKKFGYCYITDATGPNPWNRLPSYWEAEVAAVRRVNERPAP